MMVLGISDELFLGEKAVFWELSSNELILT